jgi:hypothetical protein
MDRAHHRAGASRRAALRGSCRRPGLQPSRRCQAMGALTAKPAHRRPRLAEISVACQGERRGGCVVEAFRPQVVEAPRRGDGSMGSAAHDPGARQGGPRSSPQGAFQPSCVRCGSRPLGITAADQAAAKAGAVKATAWCLAVSPFRRCADNCRRWLAQGASPN